MIGATVLPHRCARIRPIPALPVEANPGLGFFGIGGAAFLLATGGRWEVVIIVGGARGGPAGSVSSLSRSSLLSGAHLYPERSTAMADGRRGDEAGHEDDDQQNKIPPPCAWPTVALT